MTNDDLSRIERWLSVPGRDLGHFDAALLLEQLRTNAAQHVRTYKDLANARIDAEKLRAENAALREQLAARETVPVAVPVDVLEKLIERWGELRDKAWLKDTASNDEIGHAIDECVIDLRIAVDALKQRETVPAMTREAAYEVVERELRAITGFDGIRFMRLNVHPWTVRAFEKDKSSAPKLIEAVDALKGGKNG